MHEEREKRKMRGKREKHEKREKCKMRGKREKHEMREVSENCESREMVAYCAGW